MKGKRLQKKYIIDVSEEDIEDVKFSINYGVKSAVDDSKK